MSKRILAKRMIALAAAYAFALQTMLPIVLAAAAPANAIICVGGGTAGAPVSPATGHDKACPCAVGCAMSGFGPAMPGTASIGASYVPASTSAVSPPAYRVHVSIDAGAAPQSARAPPVI